MGEIKKGPADEDLSHAKIHVCNQPQYTDNKSDEQNFTGIKIEHNGTFDIATGRSRKETHWRNRQTTWNDFLNRIKETHRTAETQAEYKAAKKSRQDEIKDIGGFVGGYINTGRRKAENILHRQLITLDIDFAQPGMWDEFTLIHDYAAAIYSTHKHEPDSPRLRLIIPLNREVDREEYKAISRWVAGSLNINAFDDTTFEVERLMYWPSTSKDGKYEFKYQDGNWLNADEVLATYTNWKDTSSWPVSDRVEHAIRRELKKQGDPLEKDGIIGAFCRAYSDINEVILSLLDDVYEPTSIEGRYTYKEGSTAAGLIVYDDKFAYSHHGTDPISGKLCNAFDLVRIHKFGLKDEDAKPDTPVNKLPSYMAMQEFAAADNKVKHQIGIEKLEQLREDFGDMLDDEQEGIDGEKEDANTDWLKALDVDRKGNIKNTINNIELILNNDLVLKNKFARDLFEKKEVVLGKLPWRTVDAKNNCLSNIDDAGIRGHLEKIYNITGVQKIYDAMGLVMEANSFHPIKDYLEKLTPEKGEEVETLTIDYLGVEDNPYTRATTRKELVAAVKRVYEPGCKFDYVLTLIGKQGQGKSKLLKKLGKKWFSDSFYTFTGKDAYEQVQGAWLIEMAELSALKKAEIEAVKQFITKQEDRFRVAYGKRIETFPRECVFFATTNDSDFLRDPTGNRRFWPQQTFVNKPKKDIDKDLTDEEIDRIWAQALYLYKNGETIYLDKELEGVARNTQEAHREVDEWTGRIEEFLDIDIEENWYDWTLEDRKLYFHNCYLNDFGFKGGNVKRERVCTSEIWVECLQLPIQNMDRLSSKRIHSIMRNLPGWEEHKGSNISFGKAYGKQRAYVRVTNLSGFANPQKIGKLKLSNVN